MLVLAFSVGVAILHGHPPKDTVKQQLLEDEREQSPPKQHTNATKARSRWSTGRIRSST